MQTSRSSALQCQQRASSPHEACAPTLQVLASTEINHSSAELLRYTCSGALSTPLHHTPKAHITEQTLLPGAVPHLLHGTVSARPC